AVTLINVPTSGSYRGALRIYSLSEGAPVVDVRISTSTGALLAQSALLLEGEPRYAQILSLSDAFPAIRHTDRVTIQVRSRDAAEKIWAFVSITSNTTQAVAIVAPD
ncbi:MAG TPA: hypothetical protein VFO89_02730, partial [Thermoanaerobaculia bacterium]|nr:hypothetical protein [Thermoanaerobaculia bacterium]